MIWFFVFCFLYYFMFLNLDRPTSTGQFWTICMEDDSHLHAVYHNYVSGN